MIRKLKSGQYLLYCGRSTRRPANAATLGTFGTRAKAEKHELL